MRLFWHKSAFLALAVLAGCGGPTFESPADEVAYLKSLADPTAEQWTRRVKLERAMIEARFKEAAGLSKRKDYLAAQVLYEDLERDLAGREEFRVEFEKAGAFAALEKLSGSGPRSE